MRDCVCAQRSPTLLSRGRGGTNGVEERQNDAQRLLDHNTTITLQMRTLSVYSAFFFMQY